MNNKIYFKCNAPLGAKRGSPMIRVMICDDAPLFGEKMREAVSEILKKYGLKPRVHVFAEKDEIGYDIMRTCDIAFLDIDFNNKEYTGIDIARELRKFRSDTIIIFVTNFIEYAPEGYEVQAFRYLLKENISSKLEFTLNAALKSLKAEQATFKIQINGEIIDLPLKDILYIESEQHLLKISLKDKDKTVKQYSFYSSLSKIEEKLENRGFLRIHRSYLVNMAHIKKFNCHGAILSDGTSLSVSEKNYAELKKKYLLWRGR